MKTVAQIDKQLRDLGMEQAALQAEKTALLQQMADSPDDKTAQRISWINARLEAIPVAVSALQSDRPVADHAERMAKLEATKPDLDRARIALDKQRRKSQHKLAAYLKEQAIEQAIEHELLALAGDVDRQSAVLGIRSDEVRACGVDSGISDFITTLITALLSVLNVSEAFKAPRPSIWAKAKTVWAGFTDDTGNPHKSSHPDALAMLDRYAGAVAAHEWNNKRQMALSEAVANVRKAVTAIHVPDVQSGTDFGPIAPIQQHLLRMNVPQDVLNEVAQAAREGI